MTSFGQWVHIADHAWERYGIGTQYTIHEANHGWVARGFSLRPDGAAVMESQDTTYSLDSEKNLVQRWESAGICQQPWV